MRGFVFAVLFGFASGAWGWVECDPDAISADRFEGWEMSELLADPYFAGGNWLATGDYSQFQFTPEGLVVVSPVSGTTGDGGSATVRLFNVPAEFDGGFHCRSFAKRSEIVSGADEPTVTIAAITEQPGTVSPNLATMPLGDSVYSGRVFLSGEWHGSDPIQIFIDWNTIPADEESAVILRWYRITPLPRPGNFMTGF